MEFWGIEVKPGQSLKVEPDDGQLIHISQASLGEVKDGKGAKNVYLHLKIDGKDMVFGSLSSEDRPQIMCDLVVEKEFELTHSWKNGSVYFLGYKADDPSEDDEALSDFSDSDEEPIAVPEPEAAKAEPKAEAAKKPAKAEEVKPDAADEDDSDSDDSEDEDDSDDSDEEMASSDEEEEAAPQPPQPTKKRPAESPKNNAGGKKAKPNQNQNQKGGSPFAGKGNGKPQQGGNKFNKGQKGKAGGQRR